MLFEAYLHQEMKIWDFYLHSLQFDEASLEEQKRYISYEYGYVAAAIDEKAPDVQQHINAFEEHIRQMEGKLPKATLLTYRSSLAAYKAMTNKIQFLARGLESFNLAKEAYLQDSLNPKVLALKGNIDFYAPKAFGGNKKRALEYFRTAQRLYELNNDTTHNWYYVACRLCIIQCEDKTGNTGRALVLAEQLIRQYPDYVFLRDTYLPDLRKRNRKQ